MKTIFVVLILLTIAVVGAGFYRGWFVLSSSDADKAGNQVDVNLKVDKEKMQEDAEAVKEKAAELTGQDKE